MTHQYLPLDGVLLIVAIGAYVVAALALLVYFFSREEWLKHLGIPLAIAGCFAQFAQLVARFEITHIWPLLNLYGSLSLFAAVSVLIFLIFAFRYDLWFAGGFLLALAALFLAYGATWNEGVMPAVPSLQSYWAKIHVPLVVSSYSAFMVSFVLAIVYLVKFYFERSLASAPAMSAAAAGGTSGMTVRNDTPNIAAAAAGGNNVALWLNTIPSWHSSTSLSTASSPSAFLCSRSESSPAPCGRTSRGAHTGNGTPRRRPRFSRGSVTPCTCTCTHAGSSEACGARGLPPSASFQSCSVTSA